MRLPGLSDQAGVKAYTVSPVHDFSTCWAFHSITIVDATSIALADRTVDGRHPLQWQPFA